MTKEEFDAWLEHPVTVQMRKMVRKDISRMQDMLLNCSPEDLQGIQGRCIAALGIVNMEYEDLYES